MNLEVSAIQIFVKDWKKEISKRSWGEYKAVFSDPHGNEFNLVQEIKK